MTTAAVLTAPARLLEAVSVPVTEEEVVMFPFMSQI
jgi:hypothetical protein